MASEEHEEAQFVARLVARDESAFNELVITYQRRVFALVFRMLQAVRPWGMVEVFMLGVLVSLVKLAHLAGVVAGIALWSFAALMLVMAAITAVFDPRALWARAEAAQ